MTEHAIRCYWNAEDREIGHNDISDILDGGPDGKVFEIEHVAVVKVTYEARLPAADDADSDDDFVVCCDTREEALFLIQNEEDRRAEIEETASVQREVKK